TPATGMSGHLFVSADNTIYNVDPNAKTFSVFATGPATAHFTGLSFSPAGETLYAVNSSDSALGPGNGQVLGFCASSGLCGVAGGILYTSPTLVGNPTGVAVGVGTLFPYIYVNNNSGTVVEINLRTNAVVEIATGGS